MKYSVWLNIPQPLKSELSKKIEILSKKFIGPVFEPHITVVSDIDRDLEEIKSALKTLSVNFHPLDLSLGEVSYSTTFFQNVLVRVNANNELMELNLNLKKQLNLENKPYMPHISLLYGDQSMKVREEACSLLEFAETNFKVTEIVIVPETPNPSEWKTVDIIKLANN